MEETKKIYDYEIAVIIPTFEPKEYIKKCLKSLEEQTFSKEKYEIIIILNGEKKEPYYTEIIQEIKSYNFNYKFLYEKCAGVSNARNIGIDNSSSKNIVFIDDDDTVSNFFLQGLYKRLNSQRNTIVASNTICISEQKNEFLDYLGKNFKIAKSKKKSSIFFLRKQLSNSCGKLISIDIIQDVRFNTSLELGEDSLFMLEILKNIKKIELTSFTACYYRHIRSTSATRKKRNLKEINLKKFNLLKFYLKLFFCKKTNKIIILTRIIALIKKVGSKR